VVDDENEDAAKGQGEPDRGGVIDGWRDGAEDARTRGASSPSISIPTWSYIEEGVMRKG
jgi:hypothetical protein